MPTQRTKKVSTTIQLPEDIYKQLEETKEAYGSSHNFVIEQALRLFFAEDLKIDYKKRRKGK